MFAVAPEVGRGAGPCEVDEDFESVELLGVDDVGKTGGARVDVSTSVVACADAPVDPSLEAGLVLMEVVRTSVGDCEVSGADEGGGTEDDGGGGVDGDELDAVDEIVVWIVVDGVLVNVEGGADDVMMDVTVEEEPGTDGGVTG